MGQCCQTAHVASHGGAGAGLARGVGGTAFTLQSACRPSGRASSPQREACLIQSSRVRAGTVTLLATYVQRRWGAAVLPRVGLYLALSRPRLGKPGWGKGWPQG